MRVLAVSAHPDDIEFQMAGTLFLLKQAGAEIHYINIANGCAGSMELRPEEIATKRRLEAITATEYLGAVYHESLVDDLEIFYTQDLIRRITALVREVRPEIVLALSPEDYMEDHMNACRIAITATFMRGVPNYRSNPDRPVTLNDVMLYHSTPHILTDWVRRPIVPEMYVDITSVIDKKERMLACHESQKVWLDKTQGFDSYLKTMRETAEKVGALSGRCRYAEGWRRHSPVGFSTRDGNPIADALPAFCHLAAAR